MTWYMRNANAPKRQNAVLTKQNPVPIKPSPVPMKKNLVPMKRNPVLKGMKRFLRSMGFCKASSFPSS